MIEAKKLVALRKHEWERFDSGITLIRVRLELADRTSVHEGVFLSGVAVDVGEQLDLSFNVEHLDHLLEMVYCGVQDFAWVDPSAVQVNA